MVTYSANSYALGATYFGIVLFIWFVLTIVLLLVAYKISKNKGLSGAYTLLGLLGLIGIVILLVLPDKNGNQKYPNNYNYNNSNQNMYSGGAICNACGSALVPGSNFCNRCGAKIG